MDINLTSESALHSTEENKKHPLTLKEKSSKKEVSRNCTDQQKTEKDPWLTSTGELKKDNEIKKLGKNWSASTWNRFLRSTIETSEPSSATTVILPFMDTQEIVRGSALIKCLQDFEQHKILKAHLRHALNYLSKREREVIHLLYWKNLSISQISKKLEITKSTVATTRRNGIRKLKKYLCSEAFRNEVKNLKRLRNQ